MKKRVGIILRVEEVTGVLKHYIRNSMVKRLAKYNIEIICIPIINSLENLFNIINTCDGIILPGGDEVVDKDLKIIKYVYDKNLPTLGICLGMQEMAIFKNGKIIDINDEIHYTNNIKAHEVLIDKSSILYRIMHKEQIIVNSHHHSIITKTDLNISAYTKDNIIEAVEDPTKRFFIGVQWHPETLDLIEQDLLFNYFINSL